MNKILLIQSFIAVAEEGSFTQAGLKLDKTKALISTHISQLEAHLQVKLFVRSTRQMALTETGEAYYRGCKTILEQMESLETGLCERQDAATGLLHITAPLNYGQTVITPLIAEFMKQYPEIEIDLNLSDKQVDLIQEGIDFAFRIGILEDSRLIALKLQTFDIMVCASPEYLEKHATITSPHDLKAHPCIVDTQHKDQSKWQFKMNKQATKIQVPKKLSVNNAYAAANVAAEGLGITRLPQFAVQSYLDSGQLVSILSDYCQEPHALHLIYPDRQYMSKRALVFKDFVLNLYRR